MNADSNGRILAAFWGKARPRAGARHLWHPLVYHCLDVAAVGESLLIEWPWLVETLADATGWPPGGLRRTLTFLLALHDVGKLSRPFQAKVPQLWPRDCLGDTRPEGLRDPGHCATGLTLVQHRIGDALDPLLPGWMPETRAALFAPFLGHHGRPVEPAANTRESFGKEGGAVDLAGRDFVDLMRGLWEPAPLPELQRPVLARVSWRLAGLAVLSDWLGSSQDWFPYEAPTQAPAAYLALARERARGAIDAAGIRPARPSAAEGLRVLAPEVTEPSGVQAWAESVSLPDGPFLALLEDVTGGGKTEAALVLAHRLLAENRAKGLYIALPTMATANAMFARLARVYRRLFEPGPGRPPSLALAHGATRLHEGFRAAVQVREGDLAAEPEDEGDGRGDEAGAACAAWIASEQRKAFLADVGVGTIDQAILGVLPAKYQSLRLFGLSQRVLIVDEAHAYDAYVGRELEGLLSFQAALGGSAVVLSATLPIVVKRRLANAFRRGLGLGPVEPRRGEYPLVALVGGAGSAEEPRAARPDLRRTVTIERLPDVAAATRRIAEARRAGAAVAWVRNAVDDVLDGAAELHGLGIDEVDIFHARFAMGDRLKIETEFVERWGRRGDPGRRPGVLVASQVIEQSLDVDFDLLVTDLAPVDLLIQRIGRLWRHPERHRDGRRRPVPGPTLLVVSPEPVDDPRPDWYETAFPRAAWVYRHHGLLWRTARELFARGPLRPVRVPEDVRGLVEAVYGEAALAGLPAGFERNRNEAEGTEGAARSIAGVNLLKPEAGYDGEHVGWAAEARIPTRLGDPTVTLRLACWDGGRLRPMCGNGEDPEHAWALSEVAVRASRVRGVPEATGALGRAVEAAIGSWTPYDERKLLLPLEPSGPGCWAGTVLGRDGADAPVTYTAREGLRFAC